MQNNDFQNGLSILLLNLKKKLEEWEVWNLPPEKRFFQFEEIIFFDFIGLK